MSNYSMSADKTEYHRKFWALVRRHLLPHVLLAISASIRANHLVRIISVNAEKQLAWCKIKSYPDIVVREYLAVTENTKLWHGTGHFQYAGGVVVDIFDAILHSGSLNPARDVYGVIMGRGETVSISTTPLRIIARSYADTHGRGELEKYRYGSSLWWVAYYYSLIYAIAVTRYGATILRYKSAWEAASSNEAGERQWGKKVHKRAVSVWDVFGMGSDIAGNYPILIGIKQHAQPLPLPRMMEMAEVRLGEPVTFTDLSHIEVPENKVDEVQMRLEEHGYRLPVFPIELGEHVASKQPFIDLLGIKTRTSKRSTWG